MKDPLAKLFGSVGRVKVMRLFLANPESALSVAEVVRQTKMIKTTISKELKLLEQAEFLVKGKEGYLLNPKFEYTTPLRNLLTQVASEQETDVAKRIRKTGRIKAIIVSGIFIQTPETRVDLVVVGDAIQGRSLESAIAATEAELGQELRYAVFGSNEFIYRRDMRDKLVCDILDGPHKKLIDRLNL